MDGERLQLPFVQWFSSMNSVAVLLSGWLTGGIKLSGSWDVYKTTYADSSNCFCFRSSSFLLFFYAAHRRRSILFCVYTFCLFERLSLSLSHALSQLVLNIVITNIISLFVPGIFMYHRVLFVVYLCLSMFLFARI